MYCSNCGVENLSGAKVCTQCGVSMGAGSGFCPNCGLQHGSEDTVCVKCGCELITHHIKNENVCTIKEAVKSCWKKYATFSGRACRAEYWYWTLFVSLVIISFYALGIIITIALEDVIGPELGLLVMVIPQFLFFIPSLSVCVRRLHDIGKSGWMLLVGLIPYIGGIILLILYCKDSKEDNEYGTNPKSDKRKICG